MWFLGLLSYIALLIQLLFCTVAIAAGLFYIAELVEEYSSQAKKYIWWCNAVVTFLYLFLWLFEDLPMYIIICGLLAQMCHLCILQTFPFVSLTSPCFIGAICLAVLNHYLAFITLPHKGLSFSEVIAYFTIFLWICPFALFVSFSANDNTLPTSTIEPSNDLITNYFSKRKRHGLLSLFDYAKESLLPTRVKKGY